MRSTLVFVQRQRVLLVESFDRHAGPAAELRQRHLGVTPTVSGGTVTWNLPDLRLFDVRQFRLNVQAVGGDLGDLLPISLALSSAEPDLTPDNNTATVQVMLARTVYLPQMNKR
ncbi:MAG: hypothetical protein HZY76_00010 [Anaerolineae bacterium]|nr:MAG: hypothetical protein HZY76_00010 [Anaerolineae bacterium]